jgi:hypothetical protein
MIITKRYVQNLFNETLHEFSNLFNNKTDVKINFIDKESFLEDAKKNPTNQMLIQTGLIKNFEKEYPNFLVVYKYHKDPMALFMFGAYKISFCFEIAREKLKPFSAKEVKDYLKHGFAHELSHIFEDEIIKDKTDLWEKSLLDCHNEDHLAKERFAEDIADMVYKSKMSKQVEIKLWEKIYANAKQKGFMKQKQI